MSLDVLADVIPKIKKELGLFIMVSFSVNQLGYSASGLSAKNLIQMTYVLSMALMLSD